VREAAVLGLVSARGLDSIPPDQSLWGSRRPGAVGDLVVVIGAEIVTAWMSSRII
jgi:hypothetical protein